MTWKISNQPGDIRIFDENGTVVYRSRSVETSLTHLAFAMQRERTLRAAIESDICDLGRWADESERDGFSTHQANAMRRRAGELRRILNPGEIIRVK